MLVVDLKIIYKEFIIIKIKFYIRLEKFFLRFRVENMVYWDVKWNELSICFYIV